MKYLVNCKYNFSHMKVKAAYLFLILFVNYAFVWAQDSTHVTIKAGTSIGDVLTPKDIFLYPQFTRGQVSFRDGTKAVALMNYNFLFDQVLFIDVNGDSL